MAHHLTLLGHAPHALAMLTEVAASALGLNPAEVRVQIILNLTPTGAPPSDLTPDSWHPISFLDWRDWSPSEQDGHLMPGVLREPAASKVWAAFSAQKGLTPEQLSVLVHATAHVAPSATLGPGTWVQPNATVASMTRLGMMCHVNRGATIGHHNQWGDFCRINPGANTAGLCQLGDRTTLGLGVSLREGVSIGSDCMVGAGSVVLRDVPDGTTVVGVPAKPLKR